MEGRVEVSTRGEFVVLSSTLQVLMTHEYLPSLRNFIFIPRQTTRETAFDSAFWFSFSRRNFLIEAN
jgi:hypothetical protein